MSVKLFLVYNIFLTIVSIFLIPYFLFKLLFQKKYRKGLWERVGFISKEKIQKLSKDKIWFHAVSVGEASSAFPLYRAFKEKNPKFNVIFSTTTKTGQEWIQSRLYSNDIAIYFPLDMYGCVRRVLKSLKPQAVIIIETEIWPNFWWVAARERIQLALINGRLSSKSFRRYLKSLFFIRKVLNYLSFVSVQSERDAGRFRMLGMSSEKIKVGGNLKFDASIPEKNQHEHSNLLKRELRLNSEAIIIGGSTHEGEEKILLDCYRRLQVESIEKGLPSLRLILAPRHPERFDSVESLIEEEGFICLRDSRRSWLPFTKGTILLVDQIGRLFLYYSLATIAFVGKSLTARGGQNFLEAAALGKVVLFGPHMENFQTMADLFLKNHAAVQVRDKQELEAAVRRFLNSDALRKEIGMKTLELVWQNRGAAAFNLNQIEKYLLWKRQT